MRIFATCLAYLFLSLSGEVIAAPADEAETVVSQAAHDFPVPQLDDFLGQPDFWSPELSPSGDYLAGVRRIDDKYFMLTMALNEADSPPRLTDLGEADLNWVEWIDDDRLLLSLTIYVDFRTGKEIGRDDWDDLGRRAVPVAATRLYAINRDGSNGVFMFAGDRRMNRNFSLGRVVSFLPNDKDHILMAANQSGDLDLFKVNVQDGSFERVASGTGKTYAWYVDRNGEPAFRFNTNSRGTIIFIYAREDRENGKIKWRKIKTIRLKRDQGNESATEFTPLFVGPTETTYYVAARPDGEDKTGIYLYDFEKSEFIETIKTDADVDIGHALFNRDTQEFQGVYYYRDRLVFEFEDADVQAHLNGLDNYFGGRLNVLPLMSNGDGDVWLVKSIGPGDAGSYHVYDLKETYIRELGSNFFQLAGKAFGETQVVNFTARDGLELTGYLTRPAGLSPDAVAPLIVMPHGGPEARDIITFDFNVQVLVAHGYQVFQPNFRGSSGFGKAFADLGRRQWGRAMQTDVEDGFDHLVATGLADADRACIYGASYGGYVALVAATATAQKYRCAIATAGPSDLLAMLKSERRQEGRDSEVYQYWIEQIGDPRADKEMIEAVSPVNMADALERPLLMIHGKEDGVVPIEQTDMMEDALKKAGKTYQRLTLESANHSYRNDDDERLEYETILTFLGTHLPVDGIAPVPAQ